MVTIRKPYSYDTAAVSLISASQSNQPTLTQQQFKDAADVNKIVDRFLRTGELPVMNANSIYGDYLEAPDSYQEALNLIIQADEGFANLPAKLRARFNNNPQDLLLFLQDFKNRDEAVKLGLISAVEKQPEPSPVEPT